MEHIHRSVNSKAKRLIDVCGATTGLFIASPAMLTISLLIYWRMGRPILFRQSRPGMDGRAFVLKKFRTMNVPEKNELWVDTDAKRITTLGKFLRKNSLDELPQLFNVLSGEMSLVGPRPLLFEYMKVYTARQKRRHEVKPGLTGWAQIRGRNKIPLSKRRELDVWYVENWSIALDFQILIQTMIKALRRENVVAVGRMSDVDDQGFEAALRSKNHLSKNEQPNLRA